MRYNSTHTRTTHAIVTFQDEVGGQRLVIGSELVVSPSPLPHLTTHNRTVDASLGNDQLVVEHLLERVIGMILRVEGEEFVCGETTAAIRDAANIGLFLLQVQNGNDRRLAIEGNRRNYSRVALCLVRLLVLPPEFLLELLSLSLAEECGHGF